MVTVTIPSDYGPGLRELCLIADDDEEVIEANETNNMIVFGFTVKNPTGTFFEDGFESGDTSAWSGPPA